MAVTQSIPIGLAVPLTTNQVYALPGVACIIYSDTAGAAFEQSNVIDFATKSSVTLTEGAGRVSAAFLRATTGTPLVRLSKA